MLRRPDTVIIVAIVNDKIVLIDDEQPHVGSRLGFPGGRVDKEDATLLAAAKREMVEETGYSFRQWKLVSVKQPHSKIEHFVFCWLAWDIIVQGEIHLDPGEKITVHLELFDSVKSKVLSDISHLADAEDLFLVPQNIEELLLLPAYI
jgi:ADP-ribose pyrophosphatase